MYILYLSFIILWCIPCFFVLILYLYIIFPDANSSTSYCCWCQTHAELFGLENLGELSTTRVVPLPSAFVLLIILYIARPFGIYCLYLVLLLYVVVLALTYTSTYNKSHCILSFIHSQCIYIWDLLLVFVSISSLNVLWFFFYFVSPLITVMGYRIRFTYKWILVDAIMTWSFGSWQQETKEHAKILSKGVKLKFLFFLWGLWKYKLFTHKSS